MYYANCGHEWATIAEQCRPGGNFYTCPLFNGKTYAGKGPLKRQSFAGMKCPIHLEMEGSASYDRAYTRMITFRRKGCKFGPLAGKGTPGIKVTSCGYRPGQQKRHKYSTLDSDPGIGCTIL